MNEKKNPTIKEIFSLAFQNHQKNNWESLLDKKLIRKIESRFKNEMSELGYL